MYLIALVIFVILVGAYNIFINLARRKKKNVTPLMVNIQVTLNLILIVAGLIYLILDKKRGRQLSFLFFIDRFTLIFDSSHKCPPPS